MTRSTTEVIFEAVQDLHAAEQVVTRETIAQVTGLKLTIVDDRIGHLVDCGRVHRVQRGVFVPAPEDHNRPARIITKTLLPGGTVKIEIGDEHVLTLTPREDRMLGALMAGAGQSYATIELGHQAAHTAADLALQIKKMKRDIAGVRARLRKKDDEE